MMRNVYRHRPVATLLVTVAITLVGCGTSAPPRSGSASPLASFTPTTQTGWVALPDMAAARVEFMALLLADGRALVAGGFINGNGEGVQASAEIYDPATRRWTNTGSMVEPRADAAAVLLPSGKVLVAGGAVSPGHIALASAEIFDASTGTWSRTGSMKGPRAGGSATLLPNGKVLVTGGANGISDAGILATAELYDPASGTWSATGSMIDARATSAAVLLADGRVLVAGGLGMASKGLASAEVYDPHNGRWSATGRMGTIRVAHAMTALADGRVLAIGGLSGGFTGDLKPSDILASAEVYDAATGKWTAARTMAISRFNFSGVRLRDGRVLVEAGDTLGSGPLTSAELYDPVKGDWTPAANVIQGRAEQRAVLLTDGSVLVAGGEGPDAMGLQSAEIYYPGATP